MGLVGGSWNSRRQREVARPSRNELPLDCRLRCRRSKKERQWLVARSAQDELYVVSEVEATVGRRCKA